MRTVASAAEEMSKSIEEIGQQVEQSSSIANRAVAEAESTNETVEGLAAAAQKIGEVVELISDIASQTNLLALNATIEAARRTQKVSTNITSVNAAAVETGKSTSDVLSSAQELAKQGDILRAEIEKFVKHDKAA